MEQTSLWIKESNRLNKDFNSSQVKFRALLSAINIITETSSDYKQVDKIYLEMISHMKRKLDANRKSVHNLKGSINEYASDGNKIQKVLETIEDNMTSLKKSLRLEHDRLLQEEISLTNELSIDHDRILSYESSCAGMEIEPSNDAKMKFDHKQATERDISNKAVIGAIDRQLASLGRVGGWDYRDHDAFLKIWTQLGIDFLPHDDNHTGDEAGPEHPSDNVVTVSIPIASANEHDQENKMKSEYYIVKNRAMLTRKLVKLLPGSTVDDIEEHIIWFVKVTKLQDAKKTLLHDWKQVRQREVLGKMESEIQGELMGGNKMIGDGSSAARSHDAAQMIIDEEERKLTKQRVEAWRKQRYDEDVAKKREERLRVEQEQRRKEEEKRERIEASRHHLRKWKEDELITKEKTEAQKQRMKRPASADPAEMMRRRQRDLEVGKERQSKIAQKVQESQVRQQKQKAMEDDIINSIYSKIKRDPTRLQTATKAVAAQQVSREYLDDVTEKRNHSSAHNRPIALSGRDLRVGVRAIPMWRKPH